ncbi:MAG: tetratricopeptide repeat protein [Candidatus Zhuqueibacterota bacterium]
MLKARKKITRRQIKQDKFVTAYFKAVDYIEKYSKNIMIGAGIVIVVIVVTVFMTRSKRTADIDASEQLAKATAEMGAGNMLQAKDILLNLVDNYSGTKSAARGIYILGQYHFQSKEYNQGIEYFDKYLKKHGDDQILAPAAFAGKGACLEQLGKLIEAGQTYEKGAKKYDDSHMAPQLLMEAGRCYAMSNNVANARSCYEIILDKYADSGFKSDAELYLAKLKG